MSAIRIVKAGAGVTVQDAGRFGCLAYGISASGPMDRGAFAAAAAGMPHAGSTGLELTTSGLTLVLEETDSLDIGMAGGAFSATLDGKAVAWPGQTTCQAGQALTIVPGLSGNFGYLRFSREIDTPPILGSRATNLRAAIGGLDGRGLRAGDVLQLGEHGPPGPQARIPPMVEGAPFRITWGLHADLFSIAQREAFIANVFGVTASMDRMGVRLQDITGVFRSSGQLNLVSDIIVAGDIQILGDGTPVVLGRDHQPTGGYPRIATVVPDDLDRLFQTRPGRLVSFAPVSISSAQNRLRGLR
jgi:biotin-dependent carboxylase-like uncharacterized protein